MSAPFVKIILRRREEGYYYEKQRYDIYFNEFICESSPKFLVNSKSSPSK